jgi:hypothetical protein
MCIRCFHTSLGSTFTNKTLISWPVTSTISILWYRFKIVKAKSFSEFLSHPWAISEINSEQNLRWSPSLSVIIWHRKAKIRTKFLKLWGVVFHTFLVNTWYQIITHYTWTTNLLVFEHSTPSLIIFCRKPHHLWWISAALMILARRMRITCRISQLVARHIVIHSVETRTSTRWPVIWWFTRHWAVTLLRMREFCPAPPLVA